MSLTGDSMFYHSVLDVRVLVLFLHVGSA